MVARPHGDRRAIVPQRQASNLDDLAGLADRKAACLPLQLRHTERDHDGVGDWYVGWKRRIHNLLILAAVRF